jgi:hypothetical protein
MMMTSNLKGEIVDIETAFLHGSFKKAIHMEIPKGTDTNEDESFILKKRIYVLIQSVSEFLK